ncbi:hypothetical protein VTN00DRAFT_3440 [Thermoascus crustaceus]|uniref:uncharacterized protein n=1 Tax=Thermoascus crustaceus TaxID=5088 RepID=UPI00374435DC
MPPTTYAILGATGSTGSELLKLLLPRNDIKLNVYARSRSKLHALIPKSANSAHVTEYIGDLEDKQLLKDCLRGVTVIFSTVAQNNNEPGCSIAQRTSYVIVSALEALRAEAKEKENGEPWKSPTLVFLSSSALNPVLMASFPKLLQYILHSACYHVYRDLQLATDYLRSIPWIRLMVVQPGAIVHDRSFGVRLSETEVSQRVSYADVAVAMVAMAEGKIRSDDSMGDHERLVGKEVGIISLGGDEVKQPIGNLQYLILGLICSFLPPIWHLGRWMGLW